MKVKRANHRNLLFRIALIGVMLICMAGCGTEKVTDAVALNEETPEEIVAITAEQVKYIMDTESNYIILDVRTQKEYDGGHIPNAIVIPDTELEDRAEKELRDKDQLIIVYSRAGIRSDAAAKLLKSMGYSNVMHLGGIKDWPYDIEQTKN